MKSIARLFAAFATLADSFIALAGVVDAARTRLAAQIALEEPQPTVIEHQPAEGNGRRQSAKSRP